MRPELQERLLAVMRGESPQEEAPRNPVVVAKDGAAFTNSRDVAAFFEKDHRHVLEAIDNLLKSLIAENPAVESAGFSVVEFEVAETPGRKFRSFDMNRDGFTLLAMGFTGAKALKWKLRYIEAFNRMEAELRARPAAIDYLDPQNILGFVGALQAEVAKRDVVIREQGGRLEKLDLIEGAEGSMCISTAAKTLGVNPVKRLFEAMSARRWIFKRPNTSDWVAYQDKIQSGYLEHADHLYRDSLGQERVRSRVMVTAKGLVRLADILTQRQN